MQNTLIVGAGDVGQLIARKVMQHPEYGINVLGFVDSSPRERRADLGTLTLLGTPAADPSSSASSTSSVSSSRSRTTRTMTMLELVRALEGLNIQIDVVPRLFEIVGPKVTVHTIESLPLVGMPPTRLPRSARASKRSIDILVSVTAARLHGAALRYIAIRIKTRLAGAGLLPADPTRRLHARVHGPQVPDDVRRHRSRRASRLHRERRSSSHVADR